MPELPSELTREIISFLPDEKLSRYASVSRQWQLIVEEQTFREFRIKSTELADFAKLIKGNRIAALKFLQYDVQLPTYDKAAWTRYETNVDRQANNEAFTAAIEDLFHLVKSWEANERDRLVASARKGDRPSFGIELLAQSPMDPIWCAPGSEGYDYYTSTGQRLQDYKQYRFRHSYLQLLRLESLPSLFSISSFVCYSAHVRHVRGCSLAKLSMRLPNLEVIRWGLSDNEKTYPTLRQQLREGPLLMTPDFGLVTGTDRLQILREHLLL